MNDQQIIDRLRNALDEVEAATQLDTNTETGELAVRSANTHRSHPLRWVAGAAAAVVLVAGVALIARRDTATTTDIADTTPATTAAPDTPPATGPTMRYSLAAADFVPEPPVIATFTPEDTRMAWAKGGDPTQGLLTLRASQSAQDVDPSEYFEREVDGTYLYVGSYGLTPEEWSTLGDALVAGSGVPWVLPVDGWEPLAMSTGGDTVWQRYSNGAGLVTIDEGPYDWQWELMATGDSIEGVEVAGQPGWKAANTNGEFIVVMWRLADGGRWATMKIESTLADRVDGLIAAVIDTQAADPARPVEPPDTGVGEWATVNGGPLTARSGALGVWTGTEVLLVGGRAEATCPPNADCTYAQSLTLRDGAAYNPATGDWRSIAPAPFALDSSTMAVFAGASLFVLANAQPEPFDSNGGFARYDVAADTWTSLPQPEGGWFQLAAAGDTVVAFSSSDEQGDVDDLLFDPATSSWATLPDDPLGPSFDRTIAYVDGAVYLFAKDLVANPGSETPSLVRTARYDLAAATWETRADSEILDSWPPVAVDSRVFFPAAGSADGGEVNNWGRSYPYGGIYDTAADSWSTLPEPAGDPTFRIAGVLGHAATGASGALLDAATMQWIDVPSRDPSDSNPVLSQTIVAIDNGVFTFGGEVWNDSAGAVITDAAVWFVP
jgi:hypothetical protein